MPDKYPSMTALYDDPLNVEGTTYGKRSGKARRQINPKKGVGPVLPTKA